MAVAWQHPDERSVRPVGLLQYDGQTHEFFYLHAVSEVHDFRPFLNFPDLARIYRSADLFPMFSQRVMSARRPDYTQYLRQLDLVGGATPWEQLARTEGKLASDTIQLIPEPEVDGKGRTKSQFLVAGIRHQIKDEHQRDLILSRLKRGDKLQLVEEPGDPVNPRAVLVSTRDQVALGWVPNMLVDYVHDVRDGGPFSVEVAHVNGPDAPSHMRLLALIEGQLEPGCHPFAGPNWQPYSGIR
ncbi:MAG: hypothetical protein ACRDRU_15540 [Pseudonocardiaceae bacterium]